MRKYKNWLLVFFLIVMVSLNCSGQDRTSHKRQRICLKGYNVAMGDSAIFIKQQKKSWHVSFEVEEAEGHTETSLINIDLVRIDRISLERAVHFYFENDSLTHIVISYNFYDKKVPDETLMKFLKRDLKCVQYKQFDETVTKNGFVYKFENSSHDDFTAIGCTIQSAE